MGIFNSKWFKLEKKSDNLYRCKGGWLADVILLSSGIIYCFILWMLSPLNYLANKIVNIGYAIYFKIRQK